MKIYVIFFLERWMKLKMKLFKKREDKSRIKVFSNNKLKIQPRT